jgi:peptidyl-dipeptidase Dcp
MRYTSLIITIMVLFFAVSCKLGKKSDNPFLTDFKTPFGVPPFDQIDTGNYLPAFKEGINQHNAEIDAIVSNNQPPDFNNTILAFDKSGKLLTRVSKVFYNLNSANTTPQMQAIARKLSPLMAGHNDDIALNEELFGRIKTVFLNRHNGGLDSQQIRVVEKYYRDFEKKGANLDSKGKESLRKINQELSLLSLTFGENLLAETNKNFLLVIEDEKDLDGLPHSVIEGAAETARDKGKEGKWAFTLAKPSMIPFLQYSKNRSLREKIYRAYFMRGDNGNSNDNKEIVEKIVNLRVQKAQLIGFQSYAEYIIDDNMAKTPATVEKFLMNLWNASLPVAKQEKEDLQKLINQDGGNFRLQPWDWWYYAEIMRKEKFDLDENELKPYLSLTIVRDGMFGVATRLYGITFTRRTDLPVYHKDVETFEVRESNGNPVGILYLDYFPRDGKRGGAWCTEFRSADWSEGRRVDPIISVVCNFTKPTADIPSLLSWEETTTLFHEFGHALHGLFTQGKYSRTAGDVPQDYVELPSQINENWAGEPEVLKSYARHYQTGDPIPDQLIQKIQKSSQFNQGFETVEYLAASILDLGYHNLTTLDSIRTELFETNAMNKIGLIPEILPRYRTTYFAHIFNGGYAAGYYVYIWAAVLDADAFTAFKETGDIFNKQLADKFRKYCLAESGDDEGMIQYRKFRGKDPSLEPLLKRRGLD